MTRLIDECIEDKDGQKSLLYNYGIWCRFFGCRGYYSAPVAHEESIIDDESALMIDKAMCYLKATKPNMYNMLCLFYIQNMDLASIKSAIRCKQKWVKKRFTDDFIHDMKYCTYEMYKFYLEQSEHNLFELLKGSKK